ncbi:hypothetical protein GCM10012320_36020 [Sinomonas cellulolyticus]|uniref:Uncharacterized protein n=1 Tax=Sinomonas cellulolyticus TaxID=2801916 RepID=A0ABS1K441_9MICC|nr:MULTISPECIES: hypothetical protein [Sinomonas]MBL0706268.1 hypothetical protein [Sinomonas cellulolyticus]GHG61154.1 hypothetical protein GCM10012320_36020 [Sinomonas sp. KCTC 49339]
MTAAAKEARTGKVLVSGCDELSPGTEIEARIGGVWHFAGRVEETHPPMGLFWAESPAGERRIIEFEEYEVYRAA